MYGQEKPAWKDVMAQEGLDDMTLLSKVTNEQIRDNLRERYQKNIIYTSIGDVLISMNPYKQIPIYGPEIIKDYVGRSRIELPPHIFSIAEEAFRSMLNEKENQCIIISGESGAGKTEAAKKIMFYIAEVTGGEKGSRLEKVKNIILETNPLLEAFGNAKTLRNNNSSRFGKYFELFFTKSGDPDGGVITNYLLEKSRVVYQINGERNFHIFYQFCAGATQQERQKYGISSAQDFVYLSYGKTIKVDGTDDNVDWKEVRNAMNVIGITAQEQDSILRMLSAIMWIGNIPFTESKDKVTVSSKETLEWVAGLLGVAPTSLQQALEIRSMETKKGGGARGTSYRVPLNYVQAIANRDGLSKAIYAKLFDWLVVRLNKALVASKPDLNIGVLDIYGFEVFDRNSFEQLCINYVNEKLQQIFIQFTLKNEQEEYVREGIKWSPIDYFNNKIVCDLIEEKANPPGIFAVLDDVSRSVHALDKGADEALAQRLTACNKNAHFQQRGVHFLIRHYAGDVTYEVEGMVEKNKDVLGQDLMDLITVSKDTFLVGLFGEDSKDDTNKTNTAGNKIRTSANALVTALSKCTPHYVRCLKPNDDKAPDYFEPNRVMHQIKYLGLLDNVKVRRAGFAYRTVFQKFLDRYYLVSSRTSYAAKIIWKGDVVSGCRAVLEDAPVGKDEWQIGKTKVFLRHPETLFAFEDLRVNYYHNMVSRLKSAYRVWKNFRSVCANRIKTAFQVWKSFRLECVQTIQKAWRAYKNVAPYWDLRMTNESIMSGKKERHRFSLTSVRKFAGDYLDMKSQRELLNAMGPTSSESVLFSAKCKVVVHPGLLSSPKLSPRFLILTQHNLVIIMLKVEKNLAQHVLERQIPINAITSASMSPLYDDFIVLHCPGPEDYDIVIECDFKTELLAWLNAYGSINNNVVFSDKIKYTKKKKSVKEIVFMKDTTHKFAAQNPFYKKNKVFTSDGMPASSPVRQYQYRMAEIPKERVQRQVEDKAQRKGNATAALRGTTRVGGGYKNQISVPGVSEEGSSSSAPSARGGPANQGGRGGRGGGRGGALPTPPPKSTSPPPTTEVVEETSYEQVEEQQPTSPARGGRGGLPTPTRGASRGGRGQPRGSAQPPPVRGPTPSARGAPPQRGEAPAPSARGAPRGQPRGGNTQPTPPARGIPPTPTSPRGRGARGGAPAPPPRT